MKVHLVFHDPTCCFTDCLVRYCTCEAVPDVVEIDGPAEAALAHAYGFEFTELADGREVEALIRAEEDDEGRLVAEFMTSDRGDDEEEDG